MSNTIGYSHSTTNRYYQSQSLGPLPRVFQCIWLKCHFHVFYQSRLFIPRHSQTVQQLSPQSFPASAITSSFLFLSVPFLHQSVCLSVCITSQSYCYLYLLAPVTSCLPLSPHSVLWIVWADLFFLIVNCLHLNDVFYRLRYQAVLVTS